MKSLSDKMSLARYKFFNDNEDKKAGKLFLGKEEKRQLERLAHTALYTISKKAWQEGEGRLEFEGLKVYVVDDESYCLLAL